MSARPTRAGMLRLIADEIDRGLPAPMEIYFSDRWHSIQLRMEEDAPADVDAWAECLDGTTETDPRLHRHPRPWRVHSMSEVEWFGWRVTAWTADEATDAEPAP